MFGQLEFRKESNPVAGMGDFYTVFKDGMKIGRIFWSSEVARHGEDAWLIAEPQELRKCGRFPSKRAAAKVILNWSR